MIMQLYYIFGNNNKSNKKVMTQKILSKLLQSLLKKLKFVLNNMNFFLLEALVITLLTCLHNKRITVNNYKTSIGILMKPIL